MIPTPIRQSNLWTGGLVILLALLLGSGTAWAAKKTFTTCETKTSPAITLAMARASRALEEKRPEEALAILRKASRRAGKKSHHLLEFHLGIRLVEAKELEKSLEHFRRATKLCPTYAPAWQNIGRLAYETEKFDEAAHALGRAFELTGETRANLLYFQALARYRQEKWTRCAHLCLDLMNRFQENPKVEWVELAAAVATPAKKRPEVIDVLTKHISRLGDKPKFRRSLANLLLMEKRYPEALVHLKSLDHLGTITDSELMILGDICRMQAMPLEAAACYGRLATTKKASAQLTRKEAEALMAGFKPEKARMVLERGVKKWDSARLWLLVGQLRFEAKEYSKAETAFRQVIKHKPSDRHASVMLGYALFSQSKENEALQWLNKVIEANPKDSVKSLRDFILKKQNHQSKTS